MKKHQQRLENLRPGKLALSVLLALATIGLAACGGHPNSGYGASTASTSSSSTTTSSSGGSSSVQQKTYLLQGTIAGLPSNASITLVNNGSDPVSVGADGSFQFSKALTDGSAYDVQVQSHTPGLTCTVTNGSGTISATGNLSLSVSCSAATVAPAYTFGTSGATGGTNPSGPLVLDANGNLYGVTLNGGAANDGTVFELIPSSGGGFTTKTLYAFSGSDGKNPLGRMFIDNSGNIYGATGTGGAYGDGTFFKLSPNGSGGYTQSIVYNGSANGDYPGGGVVVDGSGNVFGTTQFGGPSTTSNADGTLAEGVFNATNGTYAPAYPHVFQVNNVDGYNPSADLTLDSNGNIYGTTTNGGAWNAGTVFELSPSAGGGFTYTQVYAFDWKIPSDGYNPSGGVTKDANGNLFGVTKTGGASGNGCVYEISPNGAGGYTEKTVYSFGASPDGANPVGDLVIDKQGNIFGATNSGGANNLGSVFKLTPNASGGYTESVLYSFTGGADGKSPTAGLVMAPSGALYGLAASGSTGSGVVFQIQ